MSALRRLNFCRPQFIDLLKDASGLLNRPLNIMSGPQRLRYVWSLIFQHRYHFSSTENCSGQENGVLSFFSHGNPRELNLGAGRGESYSLPLLIPQWPGLAVYLPVDLTREYLGEYIASVRGHFRPTSFLKGKARKIMQTTSKQILKLTLLILICPLSLMAQQATVKRNVNLRNDPSTANPPIELLHSGATLTILDSTPQGGYYHVKAEDGQEGWVWSKNINVPPVSATTPPTPSASSGTNAAAQCDDTLWDHVYNPQRLIVKQQCIAVTGTIVDATANQSKHQIDGVRHEGDGDTHGWLKLDPEFENLLNAGNMSDEDGNLVFEIVCKFPVSQPSAAAACPSTFHSSVQIPPVGSHVRIVGTYVQDTHHAKWMEIHPVTSITVIP